MGVGGGWVYGTTQDLSVISHYIPFIANDFESALFGPTAGVCIPGVPYAFSGT